MVIIVKAYIFKNVLSFPNSGFSVQFYYNDIGQVYLVTTYLVTVDRR